MPASSRSTTPAAPISALSVFFRHEGLQPEKASPKLREIAGEHLLPPRPPPRPASMRVAYPVSVAMAGVLPRVPLVMRNGAIVPRAAARARGTRERPADGEARAARSAARRRGAGGRGGITARSVRPPPARERPPATPSPAPSSPTARVPRASAPAPCRRTARAASRAAAGRRRVVDSAIASRSSTVAMIFGATRSSSATALSSTFRSSTMAPVAWRRAGRSGIGTVFGSRASPRSTAARMSCAGRERSKPVGIERSRPSASTRAWRRDREVDHRVVLEHASARYVARLRLALAPGRDLHQDRDLARLAHPPGEPPPGVLGLGPVGVGRGEHTHLLVEPAVASVRLKLRLQRLVDRDQVGDVGQRVDELRLESGRRDQSVKRDDLSTRALARSLTSCS